MSYWTILFFKTLGSSGPNDIDGESIATLVNKGALDVIAKVRGVALVTQLSAVVVS